MSGEWGVTSGERSLNEALIWCWESRAPLIKSNASFRIHSPPPTRHSPRGRPHGH